MGSATIINIVGYGYGIMGSYRFIYIYYLIKYCQAGGYPPDQNSKNCHPSVIRIFKISVSVRIYAHGRAGGRAGQSDWSGGSGSTVFCPPLIYIYISKLLLKKTQKRKKRKPK
jgi:hypothetical protein